MSNYIAFNCAESLHFFARNGEGGIDAYHADNSACGTAEFNLAELLNDELPRMERCPWCDLATLGTEHMRACSGYKKPATEAEIRDAYSDPTEHTKRDILDRVTRTGSLRRREK